jgi:hypothetical protein
MLIQGVLIAGRPNNLVDTIYITSNVSGYLQKPTLTTIQSVGVVGVNRSALIDTGVVIFTGTATKVHAEHNMLLLVVVIIQKIFIKVQIYFFQIHIGFDFYAI